MSTFHLTVMTFARTVFDGEVSGITVRTTEGEMGILKGHESYVAALDTGKLIIKLPDGTEKLAAVSGGVLRVSQDETTLIPSTCEWADEIDIERAKAAEERAKKYIESPTDLHTVEIAELKLKRALNRINIAKK